MIAIETIDEGFKSLRTISVPFRRVRVELPGELREVVSEAQLFLLFYLAAHIRAGVLEHTDGQAMARACWQGCRGEQSDDEPLLINVDAPDSAKAWVNFLQHLHSGETFGIAGTVISILAGIALAFFSFSGLWMYIQMWRNRRSRRVTPGWFWK